MKRRDVEVVVWGGGTGGAAAALQAARSGAQTLLLTPGPWLGGMVSAAGVCCPDGNELSPWQTGLWGALLRALGARTPGGLDHNWVSCFGYLPATAERILRDWMQAEPLLEWWPMARLEGMERTGDQLTGLDICWQGKSWLIHPSIVIDGSDRGDLYPLAAVAHRLGWEARETWGEPSAPPQADLEREPFFARQPVQSPTWVVMAQLQEGDPLALSDSSAGAIRPAEPFGSATAQFGLEKTLTYGRLPGGVVMLNWPLFGNDWHHGLERAFTDGGTPGDVAADLAAEMQGHSLAFAQALRDVSQGRLAQASIFPTAGEAALGSLEGAQELALMPYWREGRRLVALETVREQDLLPLSPGAASLAPLPMAASGGTTAIAVGNYANDHHYPGEDWHLAPKSCRWGGRWSGTPFTIPYGALVSESVVNLLAADKGIGVSHMANGATRLQPLVLNLGQAAGLAAALCVRSHRLPADLPVRELQEALVSDVRAPAGPLPLWDTPWHHPEWRERQFSVLDSPERLLPSGRFSSHPGDPHLAPAEPGERLWKGLLVADGQGGFALHGPRGPGGQPWPLITLEPALHDWLLEQGAPSPVALMGCANPWGPWLRVSRLA